jgi:DNA polymerase-3 subunit gamma/tau
MSYIVSARKYRPQVFEELIGQEHIAHTLKNAIVKGRVGHAYLFSGPRGVGKTSAARIFAKALNCEVGPAPQPCNSCVFCREIMEGSALDLVEIDGASNRRIDEVRQIRENVRFTPSSARYKIYIIDEVHMLTNEAFNALLKTLEEPPAHVVFIFATTQLTKVPQTIRSRCQQFVFKRVPIPLIIDLLKKILEDFSTGAEDKALFWIAKNASGSVRDAESILDQMISYSEGKIKEKDVFYVLGLPGYDVYHGFVEAISRQDSKQCIALLDRMVADGYEVTTILSGMIEYFRNLHLLSVDPGTSDLIDLPTGEIERMREFLENYTTRDIDNILVLLSKVYLDARSSGLARELFEITLMKLVHYKEIIHPPTLLRKLEELRKAVGNSEDAEAREGEPLFSGTGDEFHAGLEGGSEGEIEKRIVSHFSKKRRAIAEFLDRAKDYSIQNNLLTIHYGQEQRLSYEHVSEDSTRRFIESEIRDFLGKDIRVSITIDAAKKTKRGDTLSPEVSKVLKVFKGEIVSKNNSGGQ